MTDSLLLQIQMSEHNSLLYVEENYMAIFSSFSANFPLKRFWDGSRLFRVSWVLIMWFIITVLKLMKLVIGLHFDLVDITTTRISH